jgi:hypothetical protein
MKPIILDTRSLIRDFQEYAPFFEFYDSGLKDLVREAVLTRSFNSPYTTNYHHGHRYARGLAAKVMEDFEYAIDRHHDLYGEQSLRDILNQDRALSNLGVIRFVAEEMEQAADALLQQHLRTKLFEIAQDSVGEQMRPRWVGSDLLVFIRFLTPREY